MKKLRKAQESTTNCNKTTSKKFPSSRNLKGFLLVKPYNEEHKFCSTPSFTPWDDSNQKFGQGTIWQCDECQKIYLVTGSDPVVVGFWTPISIRKATRLIKQHKSQLLC